MKPHLLAALTLLPLAAQASPLDVYDTEPPLTTSHAIGGNLLDESSEVLTPNGIMDGDNFSLIEPAAGSTALNDDISSTLGDEAEPLETPGIPIP